MNIKLLRTARNIAYEYASQPTTNPNLDSKLKKERSIVIKMAEHYKKRLKNG